jgi:hypothetical protein
MSLRSRPSKNKKSVPIAEVTDSLIFFVWLYTIDDCMRSNDLISYYKRIFHLSWVTSLTRWCYTCNNRPIILENSTANNNISQGNYRYAPWYKATYFIKNVVFWSVSSHEWDKLSALSGAVFPSAMFNDSVMIRSKYSIGEWCFQ